MFMSTSNSIFISKPEEATDTGRYEEPEILSKRHAVEVVPWGPFWIPLYREEEIASHSWGIRVDAKILGRNSIKVCRFCSESVSRNNLLHRFEKDGSDVKAFGGRKGVGASSDENRLL